jgi:class 3 adenylate cyclase
VAFFWSFRPQQLGDTASEQNKRVIVYGMLMTAVTVVCLSMAMWYAARMRQLINKMAKHARMMQIKSMELAVERKRADALLCQMLPKEVADALKANREAKAHLFDSVTVYFSDIVGFMEISARSSPMEIVCMLNSLYR